MRKLLLSALLLTGLFSAHANNISVTGVSVSGSNITFNLSWENSWNSTNGVSPLYPKNWDAAWIFVKYQQADDKLWRTVKLSSNAAQHSVSGAGGVLQVDAVSDSMGVFVRRSLPGAGNISGASVALQMTTALPLDTLNFKVFGVEMVHVPQDTFQLGDGNVSGTSYFTPQTIGATEESNGLAAGALYSGSPAIPAAFPLGYSSFYCMKYEISAQQWVEFLNTLTYDQQAARTVYAPNAAVNSMVYSDHSGNTNTEHLIRLQVPGINNTQPALYGCNLDADAIFNEANDGQALAMNNISKGDFFAYLDWAGLRPMTETEYEKVCRGDRPRVQSEYAWGSTNLTQTPDRGDIVNAGAENESFNGSVGLSNGRANLLHPTGTGVFRTGIFATGSSGREVSGAAFYGAMEMSGNVHEFAVAVEAAGATFSGALGDGELTVAGEANVAAWPASSGATGTGTALRGGTFFGYVGPVVASWGRTSYRYSSVDNARYFTYGGRGVR